MILLMEINCFTEDRSLIENFYAVLNPVFSLFQEAISIIATGSSKSDTTSYEVRETNNS